MYEATSQANETPGLEDYLKAIQARKWLVLIAALAGLLLASIFLQSRTATYDAEAVVVLRPTPVGSNRNVNAAPNLETESATLQSLGVAEVVGQRLGLATDPRDLLKELDVKFQPTGQVLELTFTDTNAGRAEQTVNSFAKVYIEQRNQAADDFFQVNLDQVKAQFGGFEAELATLNAASAEAQANLNRANSSADPDVRATASTFQSIVQSLSLERGPLLASSRVAQTELARLEREVASLAVAPPGGVLRLSGTPDSPNGLGNKVVQLAGLIAGLIFGVAAAFILDRLDNTAREEGDVELAIGTSVLGTVPPFGFSNRTGASALVMLSSSKSTPVQRAREAFRRLRTSFQYLATTDNVHSLLITSAQPAEGKSIAATNLAIALAQGGSPTVLVSADMRRPAIENLFGIGNTEGLSTSLQAAEVTPPPIVSVGVENLAVIPSGPTPANPGELLGSARFRDLIRRLEATYEYVIVDTPPVLSAADSIAASTSVGGVVVLVDSRRTDTPTLLQVRSDLDRAGANVLGAILNRDRSRNAGFFSRRDRYAYERASKNLVS
ncbi:MAG: polysaccharide biosynthesis tyrosine autokinase [Acidimicrobiales bacterium]